MSYLVLARKYRPQTFEEIVGQEHVTRTLGSAIASGRVHHAFLFCGARGVGKTTAARILAKCLSCEKAPTPVPCNVCDACREITSGSSVDVQEIDGASNNSVEDIRTLRENVRYLPVRGKKKVYIIDEVHMLSTGAFNALLKTLEEPPPHAVFIFATTEVHKIPITILSRVQRYDFRLVSSQRIAQHLARVLTDEGIPFDKGALQVVAREAGGSVRDSLSLLEQVLAVGAAANIDDKTAAGAAVASEQAAADALGVADRGLVADLGRSILGRDAAQALTLVAAACERNVDLKHLGQVLLEHLRNLVVARVVKEPSALIEASEMEIAELQAAARSAPDGLLPLVFDRATRLVDDVARSALPRFALEVGLVELCLVEPLEPIGELVDRLERLEGRIASGASGGGGGGPGPTRPIAQPAPRPAPPTASYGATPASTPSPAAPTRVSTPFAAPVPAPMSAPAPVAIPRPEPATRAATNYTAPPVAVAPAAPAGASPAPVPGLRPAGSWNELTEQVLARRPTFAFLTMGEQDTFEAQRIVVAFPDAFARKQAIDNLPAITQLVREVQGQPALVFEAKEGKGRELSADKAEEQRARDRRDEIRQEALSHGARQIISGVFGEGLTWKEPEVE